MQSKEEKYIEVNSSSEPLKKYRLFIKDEILTCTCPAGIFGRNCKHRNSSYVSSWLEKIGYDIKDNKVMEKLLQLPPENPPKQVMHKLKRKTITESKIEYGIPF